MSRKTIVLLFPLCFIFSCSLSFAAPTATQKFKHADKNKDGTVDSKEWHIEQSWEQRQRSKVTSWWEDRADTNNDGKVDNTEFTAWKAIEKERIDLNNDGTIDAKEKRLCWRHARSRVNTALEAQYDKDNDGWLEPAESTELLKDRYALIKSKGKAKVDSVLEEEYDTNNDGMIDLSELSNLRDDLGLKD